jgi:hypothetical protein
MRRVWLLKMISLPPHPRFSDPEYGLAAHVATQFGLP